MKITEQKLRQIIAEELGIEESPVQHTESAPVEEGLDALASLSPDEIVQLIKGIAQLGFTFAAPAIATGAALPYVEKYLEKRAAKEDAVSEGSQKDILHNLNLPQQIADTINNSIEGRMNWENVVNIVASANDVDPGHVKDAFDEAEELGLIKLDGIHGSTGDYVVNNDQTPDENGYADMDLDVLEEILFKELSKK